MVALKQVLFEDFLGMQNYTQRWKLRKDSITIIGSSEKCQVHLEGLGIYGFPRVSREHAFLVPYREIFMLEMSA